MSLVGIILTLAIVGVLLWAVQQLPLDATIKQIIWVVSIVVIAIWLIQLVGGPSIGDVGIR